MKYSPSFLFWVEPLQSWSPPTWWRASRVGKIEGSFGGFTFFPHLVKPLPIWSLPTWWRASGFGKNRGFIRWCHIGQLVLEFILVIAVVIRGRFCYYINRMLMLVNWREGSDIAWVNIYPRQGWNFKWRTPVKIASNLQNLKRFLYSKPYFDGLCKISAVFDG